MLDIRLASHLLTQSPKTPADVVQHYGCLQAQESNWAKRVIGMRAGTTLDEVNKAITQKKIIRTRPMRGTLHYMAPEYVHMMLDLCASRTLPSFAKRRAFLGMSDVHAEKALQIIEKNLRGGKSLTRSQLGEVLKQGGIPMQTQRVYHLACYAATRKLICFGPKDEREDSFVLLDERLPKSPKRTNDEVLAELARMYVRSHGPATIDDLAWWTGLPKGICKQAVALVEKEFECLEYAGKTYYFVSQKTKKVQGVYLLGGFDEYFLGYKDRSVVADLQHHKNLFSVNGIFFPLVVVDGCVIGSWKRTIKKDTVLITYTLLEEGDKIQQKGLEEIGSAYASFLGKKESVVTRA